MPEPTDPTRPSSLTVEEREPAGAASRRRPLLGELSLVQVLGSALAAVSSAVAASTLGVAGTLIGAVIASIFATVGSALYTNSLRQTREVVVRTARVRTAGDQTVTRTTTVPVEPAGAHEPSDTADADDADDRRRIPMHWSRVALATLVVAVLAFAVIFGIEKVIAHPLGDSNGSGGTSLQHAFDGGGSSSGRPGQDKTPNDKPTSGPTDSGNQGATEPTPTATDTPSATPTTASPSPTTTRSPTAAPTKTPTKVPTKVPTRQPRAPASADNTS